IDVWWPVNNASVSGVFPLKAVVPERMISEYDMYWQVDNGQLNLMNDSMQDWPHKESWIDVSGWNWQPSKAYKITFVARSKVSNATIAQQDVTIIVNQ
ncbi:MAG TPA: hypothetical protein VD998_01615, partial [Verrucomicrobiae bacterium]|nr:hypothetical protein [Verrucomicrobiae bacterium]